MNRIIKNLTLITVLLSFSVSAYASADIKELLPELKNPAKAAELKALVSSDSRSALLLLAEVLREDKDSEYRCSAMAALAASNNENVSKGMAGLLNDSDSQVRACAIRAAGESKNEFAVEALLANVESYQVSQRNKGPYEENIKVRLKAIDSIWSLGEIGDPRLMDKLAKFYAEADDVIKMNLLISIGKLKKTFKASSYLFSIAASASESEAVRSVAFEMLDQIGAPSTVVNLARSKEAGIEKGDLIYTGGIVGSISGWVSPDLPIGPSGIFAGTEVKDGKINPIIIDCVPNNFKPGGVRNIYSWYNFTHHFMYPYYGNRTSNPKPTAAQREAIVKLGLALGKKGLKYSNTHFSQKGPVEFDCVGYTEYIYEQSGVNPTDNSYETGFGWPLTPYEQFAATRPNVPAQGLIIVPNDTVIVPYQDIITPNPGIITQNINGLMSGYGMKGSAALPEVNTNIQPEAVN